MKLFRKLGIFGLILAGLLIVGEIKCVVKMLNCNWDPIGKSEIIYTAGVFAGTGSIIGWINIKDK